MADHVLTIGELVDAVLLGEFVELLGRKAGHFTVVEGGLSDSHDSII
jgi:hypothetical protein